jgi:maltooligosyltrehalose trehalohydrolase
MVISALPAVVAHVGRTFRPVGAWAHDGGVTFRVWAPGHELVRVATGDGTTTRYVVLEEEPGEPPGFFSGRDDHGRVGDLYWFELDHQLVPDPASRYQPRGVTGPSEIVDPRTHDWQATTWRRPELRGRVIYELHVGTFTPAGTFEAAIDRLDALVDLGVNTIELMPLGDFAGERNWGYDGVMLFAPARCYGTPGQLRMLVDAAHARGLAVIIDVVYNHLGPSGNVLPKLSPYYFDHGRENSWGTSLNFDGPQATPVREFFLQNVCMWFDEYLVDGLRLDAVHAIRDRSEPHFISEIAAAAHARGGFVIAEDERNDAKIITPSAEGGWGADGVWSDDFHHTMWVALTRQRHAHFANYAGTIDEWVETLRDGWFYRGQYFRSWKRERGSPAAHLPPEKFVFCISNHDQVGNRPLGDRLSDLVTPEIYRAVSMLLCLAPYTPMLFMGQEWAASTPFPFFTDLPADIGDNLAQNRIAEFRERGANYPPEMLALMPDPQGVATFRSAKLNWAERDQPAHRGVLALYRECLHLRARHAIFQSPGRGQWSVEKLRDAVLMLRWRDAACEWLLLLSVVSTTTLEPHDDEGWERLTSSNEQRFGGLPGREITGPGATLWRRASNSIH